MIISLQGVANARDLGGTVTKYGTIQPDRLIRSGALNEATVNDVQTLLNHKLCRVIDLRTEKNIENAPDVQIDGVQYVNISILEATTFGISYNSLDGKEIAQMLDKGMQRISDRNETADKHMQILYRNFVTSPYSRSKYGEFIKLLANNSVCGATLWHCSAGKDRVGTCTAILLHLLGATDKQIMDDYLLTNEQIKSSNVSILNKVAPFVSDSMLKLVESMLIVDKSYLQAFWTEIENNFGNVNNFVSACGITTQDIENLRKNYLI